jgi:hypothetical protein
MNMMTWMGSSLRFLSSQCIPFRRFGSVSDLYKQIVISDSNQRLEAAVREYSNRFVSYGHSKAQKYVSLALSCEAL